MIQHRRCMPPPFTFYGRCKNDTHHEPFTNQNFANRSKVPGRLSQSIFGIFAAADR